MEGGGGSVSFVFFSGVPMRLARKKFPVAGAPARERERKSGKKERTDEFGDGFAASEGEGHGDLSSPAARSFRVSSPRLQDQVQRETE